MTRKSGFFRLLSALIILSMMLATAPATVAQAAISQPQAWSLVYSGAAYPGTYSYTVDAADNRMLIVAVSSTTTTSIAQTAAVTYGGQSLTLRVGTPATTALYAHTYLFYLLDTPAVMDGAPQNLVVTLTGGTSRYNYVYAAVYADTDQSANPFTDAKNFNSNTNSATVGPFNPVLSIGGGDQAVEIVNLSRTATPARTITAWAANWTGILGPASSALFTSSYIATNSTPGTTNSTHTASGTCYRSMSAMSIKPYVAFTQQGWSTVYAGAAFPGTYSYTVDDGINRMLVVAVSSTTSAAAAQTATVTYGGQSLTRQVGTTTSSITHTYLFYLIDTPSVMDGAPHNLVVTLTGGTSRYNYVYAAVYQNVDQSSNPITDSKNYNSGAAQNSRTVGPFNPVLAIGSGGQAVEIVNLTGTSAPDRTMTTWAAYWSSAVGPNSANSGGWYYGAYAATNSTPGTTDSRHTASANCYRSMSGMSIKPFSNYSQQGWSVAYAGAAYPGTYSYTVGPGVNRMLIVAVSSSRTTAGTQTATVSYGGVNLTQQVGDGATNSMPHTYLFYLRDTPAVMDGSTHNLVVTITGGTPRYNYVYVSVYKGVDQSANPFTDSRNYNGGSAQSSTVGPFSPALTIGARDQAVEIVNLTRTGSPARTINTWSAYWSPALGPNSSSVYTSAYAVTNNTPGTTTSQHTASGTGYRSMSAMSIKTFNDVPTAVDDAPPDVEVNSGLTNIAVLPNDSFGGDGPGFGAITITIGPGGTGTATVNKNGTLYNPADDSIDFTPTLGYSGPVVFTYRICDATGDCDTAAVRFNVSSPLSGIMSAMYPAMLYLAPDFGLQAQTLSGTVQGGAGGPYTVTLHVLDPDGGDTVFAWNNIVNTFTLDSTQGGQYFGCDIRGRWRANFTVQDILGTVVASNTTSWSVEFPQVHGIP